jgi:hypothetical protein
MREELKTHWDDKCIYDAQTCIAMTLAQNASDNGRRFDMKSVDGNWVDWIVHRVDTPRSMSMSIWRSTDGTRMSTSIQHWKERDCGIGIRSKQWVDCMSVHIQLGDGMSVLGIWAVHSIMGHGNRSWVFHLRPRCNEQIRQVVCRRKHTNTYASRKLIKS